MDCLKGWRWRDLTNIFMVLTGVLAPFIIFTAYKFSLQQYDFKPHESARYHRNMSTSRSVLDIINTTFPSPSRIWKVKAIGHVYVYSAHRRCRNSPILVVNGWEHKPPRQKSPHVNYTCCILAANGSLFTTSVQQKFAFIFKTYLSSIRAVCRDPVVHGNYMVLVVRSSGMNKSNNFNPASLCPLSTAEYVEPTEPIVPGTYRNLKEAEDRKIDQSCLPIQNRNPSLHKSENFSLAICAKLAYGDLEPNLLVEWIEYNRKMGVSKIAVYIHRVNQRAFKVVRHYEQLGIIIILGFFNMPLKTDTVPRRKPSLQHWNDEQVALYDCHDQLRLFKYMAVVDFDEFIVPNLDKDFVGLTERLFKSVPLATEFHLRIRYHYIVRNANRSGDGESDGLYAEKYKKNTCPTKLNPKMITVPGRMTLSGSSTHGFTNYLKPYKTSVSWADTSMVYISHYKRCHKPTREECFKMLPCNTSNITIHVDQQLKQVIHSKKKLLLG